MSGGVVRDVVRNKIDENIEHAIAPAPDLVAMWPIRSPLDQACMVLFGVYSTDIRIIMRNSSYY